MSDLISRAEAIDALCNDYCGGRQDCKYYPKCENLKAVQNLPSAQPEILACGEGELNVPDTNVGDMISRQATIDAVARVMVIKSRGGRGNRIAEAVDSAKIIIVDNILQLPPIQPTDNLQKLADEIASFKRCVKSDNSDYLTGYLCALSVVEGMIADMRGES